MFDRLLIGAAALLGLAGAAAAADLPSQSLPPAAPAPLFAWTGFYGGLSTGGAFDNTRMFYPTSGYAVSHSATGALIEGQVGYNYQISSFVIGAEGEGGWTGLKGHGPCGNPVYVCTTEQDWLASITGRVGYAFGRALVYGKGGVAFTSFVDNGTYAPDPAFNQRNSASRTGWTLGAGFEYAFWDHWSGFVEYDHYDFGDAKLSSYRVATGAFVNFVDVEQSSDLVKVGVNYWF